MNLTKENKENNSLCDLPDAAPLLYIDEDDSTNNLLTTLNCYILTPLCVFGCFSNAGALALFNRPPRIVSAVAVYLNTLLILDILQLFGTAIMTTPYFCESAYSDERHSFHTYCLFYYRYIGYIVSRLVCIVDTGQVWSLSALAVHRYWKISQPMKSLANDTPIKAVMILMVLFVFDIGFRLPMFFELKFAKHPNLNISVIAENVKLGRNGPYNIVYYLILNTTIYNIVPFVLLFLMSFLTIRSLIAARRHEIIPTNGNNGHCQIGIVIRNQTKSSRRRIGELKATFSICIMTVMFLLFHVLFIYEVVQRYRVYVQDVVGRHLHVISDLNTILAMLSSTLNAFVYIAITQRCKQHLETKRQRTVRFKNCRSNFSLTRTLSSCSADVDQNNIVSVDDALILPEPKMKKEYSSLTMCSTDF